MTAEPFNPPRVAAPVPVLPRRPCPVMTVDSLKLWRKLIEQTRKRGDVHAALELEMLLGLVPEDGT